MGREGEGGLAVPAAKIQRQLQQQQQQRQENGDNE